LDLGKGPDKKKYKKLLKEKNLQYSVVLTMWLSAENYPKLLGTHPPFHSQQLQQKRLNGWFQ